MEQIKTRVLAATTLDELYRLQIEVQEQINEAHATLKEPCGQNTEPQKRGKLVMLYELKKIIVNRIDDAREANKAKLSESNRQNYNFRKAAREVLDAATFERIANMAARPRKEVAG